MEKVIITGGAGFIGSHIADALVEEGYDVHIIDNISSGKKENINPRATLHIVDIRDYTSLVSLFKDVTYVFHEAAYPQVQYSIENPIETHEINVSGLLNVLEASRVNNVKRLIFASSSAIYGNQDTLPITEEMIPMPLSPYGAHKYIGEVYCKMWAELYGLETVCLRYFNVYGERQSFDGAYSSVIAKFLNLRKLGKPLSITGDGEQTRDFVHVKDVVSANILAMKGNKVGKGEVVNIGGMNKISVNRIAELIGGPIEYIPSRIEPRATEASISHAQELLGWQPHINPEEGVTELKNNYDK
jgi:nucleoside-diphosphate-sugar epimerase